MAIIGSTLCCNRMRLLKGWAEGIFLALYLVAPAHSATSCSERAQSVWLTSCGWALDAIRRAETPHPEKPVGIQHRCFVHAPSTRPWRLFWRRLFWRHHRFERVTIVTRSLAGELVELCPEALALFDCQSTCQANLSVVWHGGISLVTSQGWRSTLRPAIHCLKWSAQRGAPHRRA